MTADTDSFLETLDPQEALDVYLEQSQKTSLHLSAGPRRNLLIWGAAWLIGYGALWVGARQSGTIPPEWAFIIFAACLVGAGVGSTIVGAISSSNLKGPSSLSGALFGWSFALAFTGGMTMIAVFCQKYDLGDEAMAVIFNAAATLILGCLYMVGGAMFLDRVMFTVGVVMLVLSLVGTLIGVPTGYLVMALLGGGVLCAQFTYETWRAHRSADLVK